MQQIGRYKIVNELGRGAMGVVYRALDPAIGRTVAIKTFRLEDLADKSEREKVHGRLFREAHSAGILSHPGIVTIYDIADDGDVAYIAMEYVNGSTLEKVMTAEQPPEQAQILRILKETADAMDYAHGKGIVHRDIKPANIMINESGAAKITDFGVAKILSHNLTQADTILGTPNYMSPEQIEAKALDGRSDQFALAVISYEMLTGEKPFLAESLPSLIFKIVREEPVAPQHLNPTLGPGVEDVIRKALSKSSQQRYPTCTEFIADLARALNELPGWRSQARGEMQSMATVVAPAPAPEAIPEAPPPPPAPAPVAPPPEPKAQPAPPPPVAKEPVKPAAAPPPVEAPAKKPPVVEAPAAEPRTRKAELEAAQVQPPSSLPRLIATVVVGVALAGGGYFGWKSFSGSSQPAAPPTSTEAQPTIPSPGPAAPAKATEPVAATPKPQTAPPQPPAPKTIRPAAPTEVAVEMTTTPPGATVVFDKDDSKTCTTPCSMPLAPGRHVYSVTLAGHRPQLKIIELPRDATQSVNLDKLAGTVMVSTKPAGATILINGQPHNQKTPAVLSLPAGRYKLELVLEGHPKHEETLEVKDRVTATIDVDFSGR